MLERVEGMLFISFPSIIHTTYFCGCEFISCSYSILEPTGDSSSSPPVPESGQSSVGGMGMRLVGGGYTTWSEGDYHIEGQSEAVTKCMY